MSHTISIRLPEETAQQLDAVARASGQSKSAVVKSALEASFSGKPKPFMSLAGSVVKSPDLSQRKGFSKG
ncbi:MAG: ribbon-helix-helix protein, CopG family [Opitutales bacterium]